MNNISTRLLYTKDNRFYKNNMINSPLPIPVIDTTKIFNNSYNISTRKGIYNNNISNFPIQYTFNSKIHESSSINNVRSNTEYTRLNDRTRYNEIVLNRFTGFENNTNNVYQNIPTNTQLEARDNYKKNKTI